MNLAELRLLVHQFKNSRVYKNFFALSVSQIGNYIIPLLVIPYLTRALGPDKFGAVTFAQVFVSYFTLIINYGFDYTVTRRIAANKGDSAEVSSIFYNVLYTKACLFILSSLVLILLLQIPRFSGQSILIITTHLINIGFIFYPSWFFQGMQDLRVIAILSFLLKFLYAVFVFILIRNEGDYLLNNLLLSISQIFVGLLSVYIAIRKYKLSYTPLNKPQITSLLIEGKFFFLSTLVINAYTYTNTFLLGLLSTEKETAYFNVVYRIIFAIQGLLFVPFNMSFFPYIAQSFSKKDYINSHKKLLKACLLLVITTIASGVALYFNAERIVLVLFKEKFLPSASLLRILAFVPILMGLVNIFGFNGLMPLRQDKTFLVITTIAGCISLCLNIIFIPYYNSYAVAFVWMLTEFTICTLCFIFYKRALKRAMANSLTQLL